MTLALDRPATDNLFSSNWPTFGSAFSAVYRDDPPHRWWAESRDALTSQVSRTEVLQRAVQDLLELQRLPVDWDSYGGSAVSEAAATKMRVFLHAFVQDGGATPQLTPLGDGGVQVEWRVGHALLEIEVASDGAVSLFGRDTDGRILLDEGDLNIPAGASHLERALSLLQDMSHKVTHRVPRES